MAQFVGKRIIPRHEGVWSIKKAYEPLVIVLDETTGDSYTSRRDVPAGTALDNASYWAKSGVFNAQLKETHERMNEDFERKHEAINADLEAERQHVEETVAGMREDLSIAERHVEDTVAGMREDLSVTEQRLSSQVQTAEKNLSEGVSQMDKTSDVLNKRMDHLVASNTLDENTELLDIRTDEKGNGYESAGAAVRAMAARKAETSLAYGMPFVYRGGLNLNTKNHTVEFPGNFIFFAGGQNYLIAKPQPIPYNPEALLTYLCFDPENEALVTVDWHSAMEKGLLLVFVVDCKSPNLSYGMVPFTVDGIQPFEDGTVDGGMIREGSIPASALQKNAVIGEVFADESIAGEKMLPGAFLASPLVLAYTASTFGAALVEMNEEKAIHVVSDETMANYRGGGFQVRRPEWFDTLYIRMEYASTADLEFYVVDGFFYRAAKLPSTNGEMKEITLTLRWEDLKEHMTGNPDHITVVFTGNVAFELTIQKLTVSLMDTFSERFGMDYARVRERLAAAEQSIESGVAAMEGLDGAVREMQETAAVQEETLNRLGGPPSYTGKKILFLGDSITALNTGERGWVRYFNEIIKPEAFVNLAVSSARWCDYPDTVYDGNPVFSGPDANHNNVMGNQIEKLLRGKDSENENYQPVNAYASFDLIIIACGTNDGTTDADIEPSFTKDGEIVGVDELDRTRFASAFRYTIEKLEGMYPEAQILICTPIQGYVTTRSYASTKAKGDYLKLLAGRMSLEVIDTFHCGICDIFEKKNANGRYLIDGLHPNEAGAKRMGQFIARSVMNRYR